MTDTDIPVGSRSAPVSDDDLIDRLRAIRSGSRAARRVDLPGTGADVEAAVARFRRRLRSEATAVGWWQVAGSPAHAPGRTLAPQLAAQALPLARAVHDARRADGESPAPRAEDLLLPVVGPLRRWGIPEQPDPAPRDPLTRQALELADDHRSAATALAAVVLTLCHRDVPAVVDVASPAGGTADAQVDALAAALEARRDLPVLVLVHGSEESSVARTSRAVAEAPAAATAEEARALAAAYRFVEAADVGDRALAASGPDPDLVREIATWAGRAGRAREAATRLTALAADLTAREGATTPRTLATRLAAAFWCGTAGDLPAAQTTTDALLADLARHHRDHPATWEARFLAATWHARLGRLDAALSTVAELGAHLTSAVGPSHPETLRARDLHAHLLSETGRTGEALAAYADLARDRAAVLGADAPAVLTDRSNHAVLLGRAGASSAALAALGDLLADRTRVLGPGHPDTALTRENLGTLLRGGDRPTAPASDRRTRRAQEEAAATRLRDALERSVTTHGAGHPAALELRAELASWLGATGRTTDARHEYETLLPDQERVLGASHPEAVRSRRNLVALLQHAGRPAHAARVQRAAVQVAVETHGPDAPDTCDAAHDLARLLGATGEATEAVSVLADVLAARRRSLPAGDASVMAARHDLAVLRGRAGEHRRAAADLQALADELARREGADHPRVLAALASAAHWTVRAGDTAAARAAYDDLLPRLCSVLGPAHPEVRRVRADREALDAPGRVEGREP